MAGAEDLERQFLEGETRMAVRSALQRLSAQQRHLIERRFYEEVPITELAEEMGLTRQGVYERQRGILRRLRATLSPSFAGE